MRPLFLIPKTSFLALALAAFSFALPTPIPTTRAAGGAPPAQTLYISNFNNRTIGAVDSAGGAPTAFATGAVTNTLLSYPDGMAFDAAGNLYVTVLYLPFGGVTRIAPDGTKTLYAVGGSIFNPTGLVADRAGNLFVANQDRGTISKVLPHSTGSDASNVLLYASGRDVNSPSNTPNPSGLYMPDGLALDSAGNLYVANLDNSISKITPNAGGNSGTASIWISGNGLLSPSGLAFDPAGNLYVSNSDNQVLRLTPQPNGAPPVVTVYANNRNGTINVPSGIAFDAAGNLFVANSGNSTISKITPDGADTLFASGGSLARPAFVTFPVSPNTPAAPTITGISQDTGVAGDGVTRANALVISGGAEPASTVTIYLGGSPIGAALANATTGEWSFDYTAVALPDRAYLLTASATNASGYVSAASVPFQVTVDTLPPTVTIGSPVVQLADGNGADTIEFTVTFSGADAVALTPDKIALVATGSASAASVTISGSGAGTRTVTLSGLSGSGTLAISLLAGTASDLAGNPAAATGPSAAATVPGAFEHWAAGQNLSGAAAEWGADPDGDGLSNGLEFALGLDPNAANTAAGRPAARLNGGRLELSYVKARNDVVYQVQSSTDLTNWTAADVDQGGSGPDVTASTPAGPGRKFLRLVVTRP